LGQAPREAQRLPDDALSTRKRELFPEPPVNLGPEPVGGVDPATPRGRMRLESAREPTQPAFRFGIKLLLVLMIVVAVLLALLRALTMG
jgi:hypothetical protein